MSKKQLRERFMLEGAIGYITHLQNQIRKGKLKTVQEVSEKISHDGMCTCSALADHLTWALEVAGSNGCLFLEATKKEVEST